MNRWLALAGLLAACAAPVAAQEPAGPPVLDADGDGAVTREEFVVFRRYRAFAHDADGDGALSFEEFRPSIPGRVPGFMHGRIFSRVDADGDGRIVMAELDAMPTRAFDDADGDRDGRLTGTELDHIPAAEQ